MIRHSLCIPNCVCTQPMLELWHPHMEGLFGANGTKAVRAFDAYSFERHWAAMTSIATRFELAGFVVKLKGIVQPELLLRVTTGKEAEAS